MPTPSKEVIFSVVFLAFLASFAYSIFLFFKMIREVNVVEGQPGRIPFSLVFFKGRLVRRHAEVCPEGGSTRALHVLLTIVSGVLLIWICVLWNG